VKPLTPARQRLTIRSTGNSGAFRRPGCHFILAELSSYTSVPVNSRVKAPAIGEATTPFYFGLIGKTAVPDLNCFAERRL
jgi:hypothetical protein